MLARGVTSAVALRCLLVLWALWATPAAAGRGTLSEKAAGRAAQAVGVTARQRQRTAQLVTFLSEVRDLRGHRTGDRIGELAVDLESKNCQYDRELANTQAAVKLFTDCIAKIEGIAKETLESAGERGRLNKLYGKATEVSLGHVKNTVQHLNDLQRSIVVEHKNAADHLAQEVLAIKAQVSQIWSTNEDARKGKGWVPTAQSMELQPKVVGDEGFRRDASARVTASMQDAPLLTPSLQTGLQQLPTKVVDGKIGLSQLAAEDRDGPVVVKAEGGDADLEEDSPGSGESLAELKRELHRVQARLAEVKHRHAHNESEEDS